MILQEYFPLKVPYEILHDVTSMDVPHKHQNIKESAPLIHASTLRPVPPIS